MIISKLFVHKCVACGAISLQNIVNVHYYNNNNDNTKMICSINADKLTVIH